MNIEKLLSRGADIETCLSAIYQQTALFSHDDTISKKLTKISHEELNHASIIKMGKRFFNAAPDLFRGLNVDEEELNLGLQECQELHEQLQNNLGLLPGLKWLLRLEKSLERIHLGASVIVSDAQLKQLFQGLAKGDQDHIKALQEIISNLGTQ